MPSEFDALVGELRRIRIEPNNGKAFAKAIPSVGRARKPVNLAKITGAITLAEKKLAARPVLKAAEPAVEKWQGFFKSLKGLHQTFGERVAAGTVSANEAATMEASLHRLTNQALDVLARDSL